MSKEQTKLSTEEVLPKPIVDQNREALDLYKETESLLTETADILEQVDIALGRKKIYKTSRVSTLDYKIKRHEVFLTTESYQV